MAHLCLRFSASIYFAIRTRPSHPDFVRNKQHSDAKCWMWNVQIRTLNSSCVTNLWQKHEKTNVRKSIDRTLWRGEKLTHPPAMKILILLSMKKKRRYTPSDRAGLDRDCSTASSKSWNRTTGLCRLVFGCEWDSSYRLICILFVERCLVQIMCTSALFWEAHATSVPHNYRIKVQRTGERLFDGCFCLTCC